MMSRSSLAALALVLLLSLAAGLPAQPVPAAPTTAPSLVEEKTILTTRDLGNSKPLLSSARLSPDGKRLLYMQVEPVPRPEKFDGIWTVRRCRLVLRDVASGKDVLLPLPDLMREEPLYSLLGKPIFDRRSERIAVFAGIDADKNGVYDPHTEQLQASVYDIAARTLDAVNVTGLAVVPMFDRAGRLMATTWDRKNSHGQTVIFADLKGKPVATKIPGVPLALSATHAAVMTADKPDAKKSQPPKVHLLLWDLAKDSSVAELPLAPDNAAIDEVPPCFSSDGKFLYYLDLATAGGKPQPMTRVYDLQRNKVVEVLDNSYPAGAGPGNTVLIAQMEAGGKVTQRVLLHDAARGASAVLDDSRLEVIWAADGQIVFWRRNTDTVQRARISLPATAPPGAK